MSLSPKTLGPASLITTLTIVGTPGKRRGQDGKDGRNGRSVEPQEEDRTRVVNWEGTLLYSMEENPSRTARAWQ